MWYNGLLDLSVWQLVAATLLMTHVTIVSVTVYLHRYSAHRALELHPALKHFFRFWLWLTTGQNTREWTAIHRKHHAKCETVDDPHSPVIKGLGTVLRKGAELYQEEAKNQETLRIYGKNCPDDWIERNVYSRYPIGGVTLMAIIDLALFGVLGMTVWAIQMMWIPVWAAGVINGLGHAVGYRNFECRDAATNLVPWGILIGGEELHNNHHTYPTSAKLSVKPYEFDIGWVYIRALEMMGLATVRKTAPQLRLGEVRPQADGKTLEALIANRYEVMARYAKDLRSAVSAELERLKAQGAEGSPRFAELRLARRWLHRDADKIPQDVRQQVEQAVRLNPALAKWVSMREELRQLWTRTNVSAEQLVMDLQAWCRRAEDSGIASLREFSVRLRAAQA